jgi:hypothetical protein
MSTRRRRPKQKIPPELRWYVWERDNFTCHYCGSRRFLSVDHLFPERAGGITHPDNLVTACRSCNSRKGTQSAWIFQLVNTGELDRTTFFLEAIGQAVSLKETEGRS